MNSSRWMVFVDGENFTLRAQEFASAKGVTFRRSKYYEKDVFCWFPRTDQSRVSRMIFETHFSRYWDAIPVRAHYYTTCQGDDVKLADIRQRLFDIGFHPEVFKKTQGKSKGVDIMLCKDMLAHAFRDNYDTAVLVAGDGDYEPLVDEVKRIGKNVIVAFFEDPAAKSGLNPRLKLASDFFVRFDDRFVEMWNTLGDPDCNS